MKVILYLSVNKYYFYCPGCKMGHFFLLPKWKWNGDFEKPTVTPSIVTEGKCHLLIKEGKIEYLTDCKHEMAGQTIDMEEA
jgi:hypothetical protein